MLNEVYYDLNLMKILYFDLLYFLKLNNSSIFKWNVCNLTNLIKSLFEFILKEKEP